MASRDRTRAPTLFARILSNPIVAIVLAVVLLVLGILSSYFLGNASAKGLLAASSLLAVTVVLASAITLALSRHLILQAVLQEIRSLVQHLQDGFSAVRTSIMRIDQRVDSLIGSIGGNIKGSVVLTEAQYAALEAGSSVTNVTIAIRVMGNEFQDEIAQRDAYVDFQAVVMENIRRGVHYVYIAERNEINRTRARRIAQETQDLSSFVRVVQVPPDRWQRLPFSVDTVFLQHQSGRLDGYVLLPSGGKENRCWAKMSPDYRDEWWGVAQELLEESEPLPPA